MSGKVKINLNDTVIYVGSPTPLQQFEAEDIYRQCLIDGQLLEMMSNEDVMDYLQSIGKWTLEDQQFLDELPTKLESMKVEMYTSYSMFKSKRVEQLRRMIKKLIESSFDVFSKRHAYDAFTCEGFALTCKFQYLVCATASDVNNNKIDITNDNTLIQEIIQAYISSSVPESDVRELCRTDPWRTIWNAGKAEGRVFGVPSILLTDDQRQLLTWSKLYDNIRDAVEPPDDKVLEDDYLLDGWLIVQGRKAKDEMKNRGKGDFSNRMSRANEIFIPVETAEDAQRVDQMNSAQSRMIKRQRMSLLAKTDTIPEERMPDAQLQLRQQAVAEAKARASRSRV